MEYISREDVLKKAKSSISVPTDNEWDCGYNTAMAEMQEFIKQLPVADVQPISQWISVKDRLPENDVEVMLYDTDCGVVLGWYDDEIEDFATEFISPLDAVTHWMPLPEPPKDGDAE